MAFAGVVPPDVLQTCGEHRLRPGLPVTPGRAVTRAVRADAGGPTAGDRVTAIPVLGGFAQVVAVDEDMAFPPPDEVPFDEGAAIPPGHLTMHFPLTR